MASITLGGLLSNPTDTIGSFGLSDVQSIIDIANGTKSNTNNGQTLEQAQQKAQPVNIQQGIPTSYLILGGIVISIVALIGLRK
jgi:hypothetical protein